MSGQRSAASNPWATGVAVFAAAMLLTAGVFQIFQGIVIRVHGSGIGRTFTVRKVSFGVGVERTFPLHSPIFEQVEVVTRGDVRRAKLYYLRNLRGKAARIKERREL